MQIKKSPTYAIFLILFGLGAVSCSKDKTTKKDPFKLSPPRLVLENQQVMEWDQLQSQKALMATPQASLAFGPEAGQPGVAVQVRAACQLRNINVAQTTTFLRPRQMTILQWLPLAAMTANPGEKINCLFDFKASNSNGSQHVFRLPELQLTASVAGLNLAVKKDGAFLDSPTSEPLPIPHNQFSRHLLATNSHSGQLSLLCENHILSFSEQQGLVSFEQLDPRTAKSTLDATLKLELYPKQNCRAVVLENGVPTQISALLRLNFGATPPVTNWQDGSLRYSGKHFYLGVAQITNDTPHTLKLRIPDPGEQNVQIRHYQNRSASDYTLGLTFEVDPASGVSQTGPEINLAAGQVLRLKVRVMQNLSCTQFADEFGSSPISGNWYWLRETIGVHWFQNHPLASAKGLANSSERIGLLPILPLDYKRGQALSSATPEPMDFAKVQALPQAAQSPCQVMTPKR
ncbi:MAG: hypothetical protein AB7N80_03905 [Bdellovibrionales bacterium]